MRIVRILPWMITFRAIPTAATAAEYFDAALLNDEERAGVWVGAGAANLNLDGATVGRADLERILSGRSPSGRFLPERNRADRRCGYDFAASPDKSVSVAALCLGEEIGRIIRDAFKAATKAIVAVAESVSRRSDMAHGWATGGGVITAAFTHHASRWGDPHLHTHLVTANLTSNDAGWRNFDPRGWLIARKDLDRLFQKDLARRLRRARFLAAIDGRGYATLPGVPDDLRKRLSQGNKAIRDAIAKHPCPARIRPDIWAGIMNDRIRPEKPPTPDFDRTLAEEVAQAIRNAVKAAPAAEGGDDGGNDDGEAETVADLIARRVRDTMPAASVRATDLLAAAADLDDEGMGGHDLNTIARALPIAAGMSRPTVTPARPVAVRIAQAGRIAANGKKRAKPTGGSGAAKRKVAQGVAARKAIADAAKKAAIPTGARIKQAAAKRRNDAAKKGKK